ncbi:MAG TPA: helix-turn-helix domain-containing protein [Microbacterium sp.]|nr:helix-turn-helix domain-containing protein [Microbacterium sp.]
MKPWLTTAEAAALFGRSKRTIRLWVHDGRNPKNPTLRIRTETTGRRTLLNSEDLRRVAGFKDAYLDAPTFGRQRV